MYVWTTTTTTTMTTMKNYPQRLQESTSGKKRKGKRIGFWFWFAFWWGQEGHFQLAAVPHFVHKREL